MSDKAIDAPVKDVITIDLASIQAIEQFQRIINATLNEDDRKKLESLLDYISEAGIQKEVNFSDERILKIWYAINIKYGAEAATPSFGSQLEDWVLLSEYMRNFTPTSENYDVLVSVLQLSIVNHWGNTMSNKVELNQEEWLEYTTGIAVIHGTDSWDRLPEWYRGFLMESAPEISLSAAEKKMKELYGILKEKAA